MRDKTYFTITGFSYILLTAAALAAQLAASFFLRAFVPWILDTVWMTWILGSLPIYLVGGPLCAALMRRLDKKRLHRPRVSAVWYIRCLMICFFLMDIGSLAGNGINAVLNRMTGHEITAGISDVIQSSSLLQIFLFAVIIAPLAEELLFRKLAIDRLIIFGDRPAVIVSAMLFAVMHGNLSQLFYAFAVGLVLGYVYIRTGRLQYTIGMHMILNFCGSFIPVFLMQYSGGIASSGSLAFSFSGIFSMQMLPFMIYGVCVVAFFIIGLVFFAEGLQKVQLNPGERSMRPAQMAKTVAGSPGMICFWIFSAAVFISNALT